MEIAASLACSKLLVSVEERINRMAEATRANHRKLAKFGRGRADVVVWRSHKTPRAIVEAKRGTGRYRRDPKRIRQLVDAFPTVKFGVFVCTRRRGTSRQHAEAIEEFRDLACAIGASKCKNWPESFVVAGKDHQAAAMAVKR